MSSPTKDTRAFVFSCSGPALTLEEKSFFRDASPLGFILFKRNVESPDQLCKLTDDLKSSVGWDAPVLIDQEGGRVQRLQPPVWKKYPPARYFGDLYEQDPSGALKELGGAMDSLCDEIRAGGITVNCAPVLDVAMPDTHDAIGDRAYSDYPEVVFILGREVCRSFLKRGVTPVIKHLPGQGRATSDSHHDLPIVKGSLETLQNRDFVPFKRLMADPIAPACWGMVAHIMFTAIDAEWATSISPSAIQTIRNVIGFDGLLLTDDISMGALEALGPVENRAMKALEAGCDIALYCAGQLSEMKKIAAIAPYLRPESLARFQRSRDSLKLAA